jgi:uncharacterized membrane protein YqjE
MEKEALSEKSTVDLIRRASDQLSHLVRDEIELARTELTEKGKRAGLGAGMFGAAGVVALFGVAALLTGAILAIALVLPAWAAALIIGGGLFLLAGLVAAVGRASLKRAMPAAPSKTIESVRADVSALSAAASRNGGHHGNGGSHG